MAEPIEILHQDEHLLVVNKPPRMLVVPAPGRRDRTVADQLAQQLSMRVFPVHRLDEDVTGVLTLAATQEARPRLEEVFRRHRAERIYLALLSRAPNPPAGKIESRLREGPDGIVRSVLKGPGDAAITWFQTIRREGRGTLVECRLETGRRNQIRVHMADLGCPIVGDRKYGYRRRQGPKVQRPLLHAERIAFRHPFTGSELEVSVEAPEPELHR